MRLTVPMLIGFGVALADGRCAAPAPALPVLVELFTAEGCSSCPPADALLAKMIESQSATGAEIVGLGEHVDYWDRLGWKDRFSSAVFTSRQRQYAARVQSDDVYTPQMVVDGQEAFVGTDVDAARRAIQRAVVSPHGSIRIVQVLTVSSVTVSVAASNVPAITDGDRADIVVALIEDRLRTDVKAGENKGRTLTHAAVVHEIKTAAEASSPVAVAETRFSVKSDWNRPNVKIVAFVQERASRRVLGTGSMALAEW